MLMDEPRMNHNRHGMINVPRYALGKTEGIGKRFRGLAIVRGVRRIGNQGTQFITITTKG